MPAADATVLAALGRRLFACEPLALTSRQRRALLVQLQSMQAQITALENEVLVAECGPVPRVREVRPSDTTGPLEMTDEVVDELAPLLHRSTGSIRHGLRRARTLHGPLADVRAALQAGAISARHATVICDQAHRMQTVPLGEDPILDDAFADKCAALAARILPIAVSSTPGRTESQAQRLVARIDAEAEHQRRARAKNLMDVTARPGVDGLAGVYATMSAIDVARLMGRVDSLTSDAIAAGTPLVPDPHATIGQQRVAALLHLAGLSTAHCASAMSATEFTQSVQPGQAVAHQRPGRVEVQILVDARVLTGTPSDGTPAAGSPTVGTPTGGSDSDGTDGVGWVRTGTGLAPVGRDDIIDLLADASTPAVLRRLLVDPTSGALVDRGAKVYAPSASLIAWLRARDQHCRFPGCTARADNCDVDHATDHAAGGPTTRANTGLLCRRHHNAKTHGGWRIINARADGSCTFVSPTGMHHRHEPTNLASLMTVDQVPRAPAEAAFRPIRADEPDPPF